MKIMVSACLLGQKCKYNGGDNYSEDVAAYIAGHEVIPVCPELAGGLSVPRLPCEIVDGKVMDSAGVCVDEAFRNGAAQCVKLAKENRIDLAILQSRSPSCGVHQIYDGTFSGKKIPGSGVFASMLMENGFSVKDAEDIKATPHNWGVRCCLKNEALYHRQIATLKQFLQNGAITQAQFDKSLHDLTIKTGFADPDSLLS